MTYINPIGANEGMKTVIWLDDEHFTGQRPEDKGSPPFEHSDGGVARYRACRHLAKWLDGKATTGELKFVASTRLAQGEDFADGEVKKALQQASRAVIIIDIADGPVDFWNVSAFLAVVKAAHAAKKVAAKIVYSQFKKETREQILARPAADALEVDGWSHFEKTMEVKEFNALKEAIRTPLSLSE